MTTKQRAYLKGLAMTIEPIFQCGKSSVTPEFIQAVAEALEKRELIKVTVLENSDLIPKEAGFEIAEKLGCSLHMYENLGHAAYEEAQDFNQMVYDFLSE